MSSLSGKGLSAASSLEETPRTVLFYETNLQVLGYLNRTFGSTYHVLCHSQPEPLFAELRGPRKPALIVFAWDGPARSMEVLQQVCALAPQVPIIVLTFSTEPSDYSSFAKIGATAVVLKPFSNDTLELTIAEALPPAEVDVAPARNSSRRDTLVRPWQPAHARD